jgi:hypothetical protein
MRIQYRSYMRIVGRGSTMKPISVVVARNGARAVATDKELPPIKGGIGGRRIACPLSFSSSLTPTFVGWPPRWPSLLQRCTVMHVVRRVTVQTSQIRDCPYLSGASGAEENRGNAKKAEARWLILLTRLGGLHTEGGASSVVAFCPADGFREAAGRLSTRFISGARRPASSWPSC